MTDITRMDDSPNMFMDDRLNLRALKNKRLLDKSLDLDFYQKLEKKEILEMLLKSTILLHLGAEHISEQRTIITRYQMNQINSL